jgi:hypothetical protein
MASEKHWDDKGENYRVVSDDGRTSWHYKASAFGSDTCNEVTEHYKDGTSKAYEYEAGLKGFFNGGKGKPK